MQSNFFPNQQSVTLDWQLLPNGTLDDTQALATAVCVALGTNALAGKNDLLPDLDAELIWNGWPIGSKLWLLRRSKIAPASAQQGSTLTAVENYIRDAMQPFVARKICTSFEVIASRVDKQRIDALLRIFRGPLQPIELQYQILWDAMGP